MAAALNERERFTSRTHAIQRVLLIVLLLNLAVALAKFIYGTVTNSASMQADGVHSLFDSAGNVVGLVGILVASRPADEGHPYGHAKFETYASLAIGVLLVFAAWEVGSGAYHKIVTGDYSTVVTPLSFAVMIGTLAVNVSVTWLERSQAKALNSEVLAADASHTLSDALVSVGVIVGLVFVSLGYPMADPVMAFVVMAAILATALDVFRSAFSTLSDHARIPEGDIAAVAGKVPGVKSVHHIRTRGTEGEVYSDLHVLVEPSMTVADAHDLADAVEAAVKKRWKTVIEVLVHIEPDDGHID